MSHDQGWADANSACYSWCEVGVVDQHNNEVNDNEEEHPAVVDATGNNQTNANHQQLQRYTMNDIVVL